MVTVNLYQPYKLDRSVEFPSCWNDLLPEEVLFICKTLLQQKEENAAETRPALLTFLLENRLKRAKKKMPRRWLFKVDPEQLVQAGFTLLDFIFKENDLTNLPAPIQLPAFFGSKTLYTQRFDELTCGEFEDAEIFINKFYEDPSGDHLANVAAILFRPKKRGEIIPYITYYYRSGEYKTYDAAAKVRRFQQVYPEKLYSIFAWYAGCCSQLPRYFPNAYDGNKSSGSRDMLAFTKCIHAGAGPRNGTRNEIRMMKLYEFLFEMDLEALKAQEMKEEYEKLKRS